MISRFVALQRCLMRRGSGLGKPFLSSLSTGVTLAWPHGFSAPWLSKYQKIRARLALTTFYVAQLVSPLSLAASAAYPSVRRVRGAHYPIVKLAPTGLAFA